MSKAAECMHLMLVPVLREMRHIPRKKIGTTCFVVVEEIGCGDFPEGLCI